MPTANFYDPTQDDWTQRLKETPYDPLEDIRQEHEPFLTQLEALAVEGIATGDWTPVLEHLNEIMAWQDNELYEAQKRQVNADEMQTPSADPNPNDRNESLRTNQS